MIVAATRLAFSALLRNPLRSGLTMLGVIIGVGAVVMMQAMGGGATAYVADLISGLGSNMLFVLPGEGQGFGRMTLGAPLFTAGDLDALRHEGSSHLCVACLPDRDNCGGGLRCHILGGKWSCGPCGSDADCGSFVTRSGAGGICCAGRCIDGSEDPKNCGGCGSTCAALPHASARCAASACALGACDPGFADCNHAPTDGCEADLASDPDHCGACGVACAAGPHQSAVCTGGACLSPCEPGFAHCSANPLDGCEVHTASDVNHCGGCGTACGALPAATVACVLGTCAIATCTGGRLDCNRVASDGCEVDPSSDVAHCGGCSAPCPAFAHGVPACTAGVCRLAGCDPGFAHCSKVPADGCEVDLGSDIANCGSCGRGCALAHARPKCAGGVCAVGACDAGYGDCNGLALDGCETFVDNNVRNCGGCGVACGLDSGGRQRPCAMGACTCAACAFAHATTVCKKLDCLFSACLPGWLDCNGDLADGCEADVTTDRHNCGGCGVACKPGQGCHASKCVAGSPNWAQRLPGASPPARWGAATAWDGARAAVVLFGGVDSMGNFLGDTWEWDGTTWTEVHPAHPPAPRAYVSMAYDSSRGVMVLFGGFGAWGDFGLPGNCSAETLEYDGLDWNLAAPPSAPSARSHGGLAFDEPHRVALLFGGSACGVGDEADTWTYDGLVWSMPGPAHSPPARYEPVMVYDSLRGVTVLVGGAETIGGTETAIDDLWEFDGADWTQRMPVASPPARFRSCGAFDPDYGVVVLFGGENYGVHFDTYYDDTWGWDGRTWTQYHSIAPPPARDFAAAAYDPRRGQVVVFGGAGPGGAVLGDTWVWGP